MAYLLLLYMFKDNRTNEKHVYAFVDVFVAQIGLGLGAERCLTELLTNNILLLEGLDDR